MENEFPKIDFNTRWYRNCKVQRKVKNTTCETCPFKKEIEEQEFRQDVKDVTNKL